MPVHLILAGSAGDGTYLESVRDMLTDLGLHDCVDLRADVSSADKALLYGAADIFVAMSDNVQETFGLTLIEAMAAGLPVVAASWNGFRELVLDGVTGLLVPTFWTEPPVHGMQLQRIAEGIDGYGHRDLHETVAMEPAQLAQALGTLVADADLRQRLGAAGQRRQAQDYDQRRQASRLLDLLLDLRRRAQAEPFLRPTGPGPYVDPMGRRFQHYASAVLTDASRLQCSAAAQDPAWCAASTRAMDLPGRRELALHAAIVAEAQARGHVSLAALEAAVADRAHAPARPRILRAIKYGWLQVTQP